MVPTIANSWRTEASRPTEKFATPCDWSWLQQTITSTLSETSASFSHAPTTETNSSHNWARIFDPTFTPNEEHLSRRHGSRKRNREKKAVCKGQGAGQKARGGSQ